MSGNHWEGWMFSSRTHEVAFVRMVNASRRRDVLCSTAPYGSQEGSKQAPCGRPMKDSHERCVAGEGWKCLAQARYDFCTAGGDGPNGWPCGGLEGYECGESTQRPLCAPNLLCAWVGDGQGNQCVRTGVCQNNHPPRCWLPDDIVSNPTCYGGS